MANTSTFTTKWRNPTTGQLEEGQFTTKKLSIRDMAQVGVRKAQLAGGMHCVRDDSGNPTGQGIDEETDYANHMIAHLETALIQKPIWFNLGEIWDLGLVKEVFSKVMTFENSFKSTYGGTAGPSGVGQAGSSAPGAQADAGSGPTPVVGKEVSASLDA
jgi:hypothetical protein